MLSPPHYIYFFQGPSSGLFYTAVLLTASDEQKYNEERYENKYMCLFTQRTDTDEELEEKMRMFREESLQIIC